VTSNDLIMNIITFHIHKSQLVSHFSDDSLLGSSVSMGSDYSLDDWGSITDRGRGFFLKSLCPDQL
jgi:hypothetical protein